MSGLMLAHASSEAHSELSATALLVGLSAAACAGYLVGAGRMRNVSGTAPARWAWRSWTWRRYAFCAGVVVLVVAVFPTLDPVVDKSFPLHMAQHMVLMFVAAPLLALGAPGLPFLLMLPRNLRRRVTAVRSSRVVRQVRAVATMPALTAVAFAAVVLVWHLPAVYALALTSDPVHETEHACFLIGAWMFWSPLTAPRPVLEGGHAIFYVFVSGFPMTLVGAVLTLSPRALYAAQTGTGPGALRAQQLAGVLMWIVSTSVTLAVCAALVLGWLRRMERLAPGDCALPPPIPPPLPSSGATGGPARRSAPSMPAVSPAPAAGVWRLRR